MIAFYETKANSIKFNKAGVEVGTELENVDETANRQQSPQENQINAEEMDVDMEEESTRNQKIATLEMAVSKIVTSVEQRFENDPKHFTKAIKSFVKKAEKMNSKLQIVLITFSHEYFALASRGRRKKRIKNTCKRHSKIV